MNGRAQRRRNCGKAGEDAAAEFLRSEGLSILHRNWRSGPLELDLICREGGTLVFVEVRTRAAGGLVSPAESVTAAKRRSLIRAARAYLSGSGDQEAPCRFDLVSVVDAGTTLNVEHHRHVFALCETLGGGDAAWQPW